MRKLSGRGGWFFTQSKSRRQLIKRVPLVVVEPLEARRLLSGAVPATLTGSNGTETLADLPAAQQQVISSAISQQAELTASDGAAGDQLGDAVAVCGNTVVVGAPYATATTVGSTVTDGRGAAYVFTESGSGWGNMTQTAKLTASDGKAGDDFGGWVAISGDTVVIGAANATVGTNVDQGAVYVFTEPAGGWGNMTQTAKLTASDGTGNACFGASVSISGDTVAAVGGNVAYVFTEPGFGWRNMTQTARLAAANGDALTAVAINGNTVVAGAPSATIGNYCFQGAAYVFSEPGSGWVSTTQTAKLTSSDGRVSDHFGWSVAISGNTVVVGAPWAPSETQLRTPIPGRGTAYVFTEPGDGWADMTQSGKLVPNYYYRLTPPSFFGISVAISGNTAVVGAIYNSVEYFGQGAAYMYTEPAAGWTDSLITSELTASDGVSGNYLGSSVAASGNTIVVGAPGTTEGTAYVFTQPATATITVTTPGNQTAGFDQSQSFALGSFTQSNGTAPYSLDVNWGDGSADSIFSAATAGTIPTAAHAYIESGNLTATVTVTDLAGYSSSATFIVAVAPGVASPVFGNLTPAPRISYGTPTDTFSGSIAAGVLTPPSTETVAITLNGVTQNAAIGSLGNFTSTFNTVALAASATPYQVTYSYAGDANYTGITDDTTTALTVTKAALATDWTMTTLASLSSSFGSDCQCALVMDSSGNLFGTADLGGVNGDGTVFEIPRASGVVTALATFNGTNGQYPWSGMLLDSADNLFGTTMNGGANNNGTVFEIVHGSGILTTLASFNGTNGYEPWAGLTMDASGDIFGTTIQGGANDDGTVFEIVNGSGTITTLASFNGTNGLLPCASLILDAAGDLIGTTARGGANNDGTAFEIAKGSEAITNLAFFTGAAGIVPVGGVALDSSGNLFGTTNQGGANGDGTVFEIVNGSGTITTLVSFNYTNGRGPGGVVMDSYGNLFGTTAYGGGYNEGTVFAVAPGSGIITTLAIFNGTNGRNPGGGVILDAAGDLLGTTGGGDGTASTVFELAGTNTTVTSSSAAAIYGRPITFTATVTPNVGVGPTGTVQFQIDGGNLGSPVALSSSDTATYTTSALSTGNHSVVAIYSGDSNFAGTASFAFIQNILPAWIGADNAVTWNASTQTLTITGNATINADPDNFGVDPIILDSGNASVLTVDTLPADGGDGDAVVHIAAIGGNGTTTVNAGSSLDVGNFSQAALVNNGTVKIDSTGAIGQLTGSGNLTIGNGTSNNIVQLTPAAIANSVSNTQTAVNISSGSTLDITDNTLMLNYGTGSSPLAVVESAVASGAMISSTVNPGGQYTVGYSDATEVATIPSGNVQVMYTLAGDGVVTGTANFRDYSALQNSYNQTGRDWAQGDFNHDGTVNFLDYSLLQNSYNQSVKLTPTLTWATPAAVGYGTVLSATQLDATANMPGTFVYTPALGTAPAAGTQALSVTFTPSDTTDFYTVAGSVTLTVNKAVTATVVTSSNSSATVGQAVTFTATITPASGSGETGTVQFQIDGGNVGTQVTLSGNAATYSTLTLAAGKHTVVAVYSGDGNFSGSTSAAFGQKVGVGPVTVTYTLSINDDGTDHYCAGYYAVYASDTLNNGGLASYDINLSGTKTLTNYGPKGDYDDGTGCGTDDEIGFTTLRTSNNATPATATQDTAGYAGGGEVILAYGLGQTAGNLDTLAPVGSTGGSQVVQAVYAAQLLLIKGTFTAGAPALSNTGSDTGNVFQTNSGYGTTAPTLAFNTVTVLSGSAQPAAAASRSMLGPSSAAMADLPLSGSAQMQLERDAASYGWTWDSLLGYLV